MVRRRTHRRPPAPRGEQRPRPGARGDTERWHFEGNSRGPRGVQGDV